VRIDAAAGALPERWLIDIVSVTDPGLCGGKATGLAKLQRAGWAVPLAVCLTTAFYRHWLEASGLARRVASVAVLAAADGAAAQRAALAGLRRQIETAPVPEEFEHTVREAIARLTVGGPTPLSVRSSAVHEDDGAASHAGIHTSVVVAEPALQTVLAALKRCWASAWTEVAWTYRERRGLADDDAAMAVVIQRFVAAAGSGVAFSADPLTSDRATVVIEAAWGTGTAVVSGVVTPEQYRVTVARGAPAHFRWRPGRQTTMTAWRDGAEVRAPLDEARRQRWVLSEPQALELARAVKGVERAFGVPVDVEWIFDGRRFWAVQARPITTLATASAHKQALWTRANLKEVFPEVPSPLAVSYLRHSLNLMFHAYHRAQGYALPPGAELVAAFHGRPYLNLSLMQQMTIERGGDPAIVTRLFGGPGAAEPSPTPPTPRSSGGTSSHARLAREMLTTFFRTPGRGRRLFRRLRRDAGRFRAVQLSALDDDGLVAHLERFAAASLSEETVQRLH
jgi:rifampicin phosphotransferase